MNVTKKKILAGIVAGALVVTSTTVAMSAAAGDPIVSFTPNTYDYSETDTLSAGQSGHAPASEKNQHGRIHESPGVTPKLSRGQMPARGKFRNRGIY